MAKQLEIKTKINHTSLIKVAPFRKNIRVTQPHAHNSYLEVVFLTKGTGYHVIDHTKHPITPGSLFVVKQNQIHFWNITSEPEGYVIILKRDFVTQCEDTQFPELLSKLSAIDSGKISNVHSIALFFALLIKEHTTPNTHSFIIEGLLKSLFAKLLDTQKQIKVSPPEHFVSQKFISLIYAHYPTYHNVKYYAERLHMSAQNLNAICQKEIQLNASKVISEILIRQAKTQLTYTSKNIQQIAMDLGFKDASHFSKYFKRHTESSPKAFQLKGMVNTN